MKTKEIKEEEAVKERIRDWLVKKIIYFSGIDIKRFSCTLHYITQTLHECMFSGITDMYV